MMAMMTGEGEGGGGSWAGSPPRRGVSAHLERRSVTPPAGAVSLFRSTFRQKKNKKKSIWARFLLEKPSGLERPGKVPTRPSVPGEVGSLRRSRSFISLFC